MLIRDMIDEKRAKKFEKKEIITTMDLLRYLPARYIDCTTISKVKDIEDGCIKTITVTIDSVQKRAGNKCKFVDAVCHDETGEIIIRWFNQYIYNHVANYNGYKMLIAGMCQDNEYGRSIVNPAVFTQYTEESARIYPVYKKNTGISNEAYEDLVNTSLMLHNKENNKDMLSPEFQKDFNIISENEMINLIHRPKKNSDIKEISKRLSTEKIYMLAEDMAKNEVMFNRDSKYVVNTSNNLSRLKELLPFELTKDQSSVISDILEQAKKWRRINALVQGDVGSGKTMIATAMMLVMTENGYQSVLMAPTGVLAKQHYNEIKEYGEKLGVNVGYLASDSKAKERREVLKGIKDNDTQILVGTHSVISDEIEYNKLGLIIVDEEHRFGVEQKDALRKHSQAGVHFISMSATPIPRTRAITLYGNSMDIYCVESMPSGRKPVETAVLKTFKPMYDFMEKEIMKGHQAYIVCPLIENKNDDTDKTSGLFSVEDMYKITNNHYKGKNIKTAVITGKMKNSEKEMIIQQFINKEVDILIATTIIEVGVNVPNATVISIINAERFGLFGLHQLRGRVGRSNLQSYCILVSEDKFNPRLEIMCRTTSGFEIAEADLELRGTGDITGTKQSGIDEKLELMLKYPVYFNNIKNWIKERL